MTTTKKFNAKSFISATLARAEQLHVVANDLELKRADMLQDESINKDDVALIKKAEQKATARAKRCELLARFSEKELKALTSLGIDLEEVSKIGVYEIDKADRIFRALLSDSAIVPANDTKKDVTNANTSIVFEWMKAKTMLSIQSVTIKRELQHATMRQANGIRSVLVKCGIASVTNRENAENWTLKLDVESKATQKLCAAYSIQLSLSEEVKEDATDLIDALELSSI